MPFPAFDPAATEHNITARVILQSKSTETSVVLTTLEVQFPRIILAEINTHRVLSRNSASSRAIPLHKRIKQVRENPYIPIRFGRNKRGMQAGSDMDEQDRLMALREWLEAARDAANHAESQSKLGTHKQWANRILEPYCWHTAVISGTDWRGLFHQRCHPDAQDEFQILARKMRAAIGRGYLFAQNLSRGQWHMPYILPQENYDVRTRLRLSAARCARVSYTPFNEADPERELAIYAKLSESGPLHGSPLEHVATPAYEEERPPGNYRSWWQMRHFVETDPLYDAIR